MIVPIGILKLILFQLIDILHVIVEDILSQWSIPLHVQSNSHTNMMLKHNNKQRKKKKKDPRQCALYEIPYRHLQRF